jgi:carboxylesterase type B
MFTKLLCLLGASLALLPSASHAAAPAPSATLEAGVIVGTTSTAPGSTVTINQFLGVPFAAKPVRFGMPKPPSKWTNPLKTTRQAPSCLQQL